MLNKSAEQMGLSPGLIENPKKFLCFVTFFCMGENKTTLSIITDFMAFPFFSSVRPFLFDSLVYTHLLTFQGWYLVRVKRLYVCKNIC